MKPEPCPIHGIVLPGGWCLWRRKIGDSWYYQGREMGGAYDSTSWSTSLKQVQRQAYGCISRRGPYYQVPDDGDITTCRSCGMKIIWTRTQNGKAIPLSVDTIHQRGNERYAFAHFSDCPDAKDWRTSRTQGPEPEPEPEPQADQLRLF